MLGGRLVLPPQPPPLGEAVGGLGRGAPLLCREHLFSVQRQSLLPLSPAPSTDLPPPCVCFGCSQKWSKGKVKEKLANLVLFDKITYDKMLADIPKLKLITPSIISEKLKVNGSLARKALKELHSKELIRPILQHKHQAVYTRATNQ